MKKWQEGLDVRVGALVIASCEALHEVMATGGYIERSKGKGCPSGKPRVDI